MIKYSEFEQREYFIRSFTHPRLELFCEIPVFSRSVDLVSRNLSTQTISAIEFKTTNWKRAIEQVLDVSTSFDFVEICILKPKRAQTCLQIIKVCQEYGIGLYFFDQFNTEFTKPIEAKRIELFAPPEKNRIMGLIEEKSNHGN